jgi:hypothetical protein
VTEFQRSHASQSHGGFPIRLFRAIQGGKSNSVARIRSQWQDSIGEKSASTRRQPLQELSAITQRRGSTELHRVEDRHMIYDFLHKRMKLLGALGV